MPICTACGQDHPLDELELTFRRPDDVAALTVEEREARVQENTDLCVLDGKRYFVRALLPLAVAGRDHPYNIGLWVEVSQTTFERVYALWVDERQTDEPTFAAELANDVPLHPPTRGLAASLVLTGPTTRPDISLSPAEHTLVGEQGRGITAHRAAEYSSLFARSVA